MGEPKTVYMIPQDELSRLTDTIQQMKHAIDLLTAKQGTGTEENGLDTKAAGMLLGVEAKTVTKWLRDGVKIPHYCVHTKIRFRKADLLKWRETFRKY